MAYGLWAQLSKLDPLTLGFDLGHISSSAHDPSLHFDPIKIIYIPLIEPSFFNIPFNNLTINENVYDLNNMAILFKFEFCLIISICNVAIMKNNTPINQPME